MFKGMSHLSTQKILIVLLIYKKPMFDIIHNMLAEHNAPSRNLVKVIFSDNGKILYFSRALVPFDYKNVKNKYYRDLSIVSFKYEALKKYNSFREGKVDKKLRV